MSYLVKNTDIVICIPIEHLMQALTGKGLYADNDELIDYLKKHNKIKNNYGDYQLKDDDDNKFYPINTIMDKVLIIKHRNVFIKNREWIADKYTNVTRAIVDNDIPGEKGVEIAHKLIDKVNKIVMK